MSKLLVIGIDGMEPRLVEHWLCHLPNLQQLATRGVLRPIKSVFPPDSLPAWATIYTGTPPGDHGLFETIDYVTGEAGDLPKPDRFAGQTFWDEAGRRGKRVCVVNAFMAYPVWTVNGVMVSGPVFVSGEAQSHPPGITGGLPKAELGGMVDYPYRWELGRFASRTAAVARQQAALAKTLMANCEWDLFFLCLLTLDRVQHFFWRFHDPSDPAHPGPNPYRRVIFDHYRLMDQIVGELAAAAGPDAAVLVLSDHGHGQRPSRLFHANEWLRRQGYLAAAEQRRSVSPAWLIEKAKSAAFSTATRLAVEDLLYAAARVIPKKGRAALKESSFAVDQERSRAYLGKFGGSSGCGGIVLRPEPDTAEARGRLTESVQQAFMEVEDPNTGARIVDWIEPRERVVRGRCASNVPDLLFRLNRSHGISRSVFTPLFSNSPTHRRVSGGHTDEGIIISDRALSGGTPSSLDEIYEAILAALD